VDLPLLIDRRVVSMTVWTLELGVIGAVIMAFYRGSQ
jgi:hypothetical protein